jgi:formiminotetrahydrofolate cyclodeaminase
MPPPSYIDDSVRSFLVKLATSSPEPAGGSALALAAAAAAALMSLSCGGEGGVCESPAMAACLAASERLREGVQELIDADVAAYRGVRRSLGLPHATRDQTRCRREALDAALVQAAEVPLTVAEAGLDVLELSVDAAKEARTAVLGDLAASIHLAEAAIKGSLRNARLDARAIDDETLNVPLLARACVLDSRLDALAAAADVALRARGVME